MRESSRCSTDNEACSNLAKSAKFPDIDIANSLIVPMAMFECGCKRNEINAVDVLGPMTNLSSCVLCAFDPTDVFKDATLSLAKMT